MLKSIVLGCLLSATTLGLSPEADRQTLLTISSVLAQGESSAEISSDELKQFVQAVKQLEKLEDETQAKIAEAVEKEGLTLERFWEIGKSQNNPDPGSKTEISAEEQQKFTQALAKVKEVSQEAQLKRDETLQAQGFKVERFKEILDRVQQEPELQKKVLEMMVN